MSKRVWMGGRRGRGLFWSTELCASEADVFVHHVGETRCGSIQLPKDSTVSLRARNCES